MSPDAAQVPEAQAPDARARLLEAALEAFAASGYDGASTRAICAAAGVNVATLNYHYGGKERLYVAAVDAVYADLVREAAALAAHIDARDVAGSLAQVWQLARRNRRGTRLLLREVLDEGGLRETTQREYFLPLLTRHSTQLAELLGTQPERARHLLVALGFLLARFAVHTPESLRQAFGVHTDTEADVCVVSSLTALVRGFLES
jgi:AcrR family transcriptional regulator